MQKNDRLSGPFGASEDAPDSRVDPVAFEIGEEIVAHGKPLADCKKNAS
jgi:hypothetical protein